jgi:hypothetical protein
VIEKLSWIWWRLQAMTAGEIGFRLRQVVLKKGLAGHLKKLADSSVCSGPQGAGITLPRRQEDCPWGEAARREACDILDGKWPCLHGLNLTVAKVPDWHRDCLTGISFGEGISSLKLNHRSLPEGMDTRLVWEINRWQHLTRLAQVAWLDHDNDGAVRVVRLMESWCQANPPGTGLNWTSSLEVGIRLINLVWIDSLLRDVLRDLTTWDRLLGTIVPAHTWWAWAFRSPGSSANNHLLGELAGLIAAATRWPEVVNFAAPMEKLADLFHDQISRQFAPDGGNREQALHYHFFAWEISLHALHALERAGQPTPPEISALMRKAASFWLALDGGQEAWDYGDSDDALVVPLAGFSGATNAWRQWVKGEECEIGHWLGLTADFARPENITPSSSRAWQIFPDSGYATLRRDDAMLRFDASPLGYLAGAGHGHQDALHLSVWVKGEAFIIDPGTGGYYANPAERNLLASAESHNGPFAPGAAYPIRRGPFLWQRHHPAPSLKIIEPNTLHGNLHLGKSLKLDRKVTFQVSQKPMIVVEDAVNGSSNQPFHVRWILDPRWKLVESSPNGATFERSRQKVEFLAEGAWDSVFISDPKDGYCGGSLVSSGFRQFDRSIVVHLTGKQNGSPHISHWTLL